MSTGYASDRVDDSWIETWRFEYSIPHWPYLRSMEIKATSREGAIAAFEYNYPNYKWWSVTKLRG